MPISMIGRVPTITSLSTLLPRKSVPSGYFIEGGRYALDGLFS